MIISVWTGEVKPDLVDQGNALLQKFSEILRDTRGLKKYASGIDPTTSRIVIVGIWESEEAASAKRDTPEVKETLASLLPLFSKPLQRQKFEGWFEI